MASQPEALCHDSGADLGFLAILYQNLLKRLCFELQAQPS
jgi:hypothetical protein